MNVKRKEMAALTVGTEENGEHVETAEDRTATGLLQNTEALARISRLAQRYANSTIVPANYQKNPDNCFVAIELASRMGISPTLVMQYLYVVQGRPAWSGQGCIALINGSGQFTPLEFVFVGEQGTPGYGCYVKAKRKSNGETIIGTTVTMQMVKDEGWLQKNGSKWKTMPEQMMKYRAAAFFARTECPNVLMGFQTDDEVMDVHGAQEESRKTIVTLNVHASDGEEGKK